MDVVVVNGLELPGNAAEEGEDCLEPNIGSKEDIRDDVVDVGPASDTVEESAGSVRGDAVESDVLGESEEVEGTAFEENAEEKEAGLSVVKDEEVEDGINVRIVCDPSGALDDNGVHNFM